MAAREKYVVFTDDKDFKDLPINNNVAKTITAINRSTVNKICSGQVVLSLATAVKELLENSLDAAATTVEIRVKDYGISSVEVSDNGTGICPDDFEKFGMKHCTSKLKDFEDLVEVGTFGFRGEAISSLCALSNLSVTTRHHRQAVGTKLMYDHNGSIKEQISVSRQIGTTVLLENLFLTLPVRHKEFLRSIKKEFNKMVQILYSYCIISTGVRISCSNCDHGRKTTVVSTDGCPTVKDNLSNIFGSKQIMSLLHIKKDEVCSSILCDYGLQASEPEDSVQLEGYISSCAHGSGRSSADRQFYFINSRPCDPSKVSRLINDIYHQYNKHQYPLVVINIKINADDVDINVTPDKRCIFTSKEKYLLALIKSTLLNMYDRIPSTYAIQNQLSNSLCNSPLNGTFTEVNECTPKHSVLRNTEITPTATGRSSLTARFSSPNLSTIGLGSKSNSKRSYPSDGKKDGRLVIKQRKLENFFTASETVEEKQNLSILSLPNSESEVDDFTSRINQTEISFQSSVNSCINEISILEENCTTPNSMLNAESKINKSCEKINLKTENFLQKLKSRNKMADEINYNSDIDNLPYEILSNVTSHEENANSINVNKSLKTDVVVQLEDSFDISSRKRKSVNITFSIASLKLKLAKNNKKVEIGTLCRKFIAKIDTNENSNAETELKRELTKENFEKMDIIGQFNLGFIIARLKSDVFIIDQHATDEKYNFEQLENNYVLHQQPMISPQELQLTPVNESILLDNMAVFNKNGFHFDINDSNSSGRRVNLISVPHSRGWEFGVQDIEELIYMLSDAPGFICRPSRVRSMLASRACRQSVMIGTALTSAHMAKLIRHMGEINHPWSCPHGRPTIRHLININMVSDIVS